MSTTDLTALAPPSTPSGANTPGTTNRATVSKAPISPTDEMEVSLDGFGQAVPFEVPAGHWSGRADLPAVGEMCLVIFDDRGDIWVPIIGTDGPSNIIDGGPPGTDIDGGQPDTNYAGIPVIDGNGVNR